MMQRLIARLSPALAVTQIAAGVLLLLLDHGHVGLILAVTASGVNAWLRLPDTYRRYQVLRELRGADELVRPS